MKLYYFHDPMCSWCYAFRPTLQKLKQALPEGLTLVNILGGLAADEEAVMPEAMQQTIQQHWHRIQQQVPGTRFNFDFWSNCEPRRSTWPACRAVIAAVRQGAEHEEEMIQTIQNAYYLEARNPSDFSTLLAIATELGLDAKQFETDMKSEETEAELQRQLRITSDYRVPGFPSLVLDTGSKRHMLNVDYNDHEIMLKAIKAVI